MANPQSHMAAKMPFNMPTNLNATAGASSSMHDFQQQAVSQPFAGPSSNGMPISAIQLKQMADRTTMMHAMQQPALLSRQYDLLVTQNSGGPMRVLQQQTPQPPQQQPPQAQAQQMHNMSAQFAQPSNLAMQPNLFPGSDVQGPSDTNSMAASQLNAIHAGAMAQQRQMMSPMANGQQQQRPSLQDRIVSNVQVMTDLRRKIAIREEQCKNGTAEVAHYAELKTMKEDMEKRQVYHAKMTQMYQQAAQQQPQRNVSQPGNFPNMCVFLPCSTLLCHRLIRAML